MVRKNVYITPEQIEWLLLLDSVSVSEHIRRAIDEYIDRIKANNVSASASKRGVSNE